jgi:hypothetical protein
LKVVRKWDGVEYNFSSTAEGACRERRWYQIGENDFDDDLPVNMIIAKMNEKERKVEHSKTTEDRFKSRKTAVENNSSLLNLSSKTVPPIPPSSNSSSSRLPKTVANKVKVEISSGEKKKPIQKTKEFAKKCTSSNYTHTSLQDIPYGKRINLNRVSNYNMCLVLI